MVKRGEYWNPYWDKIEKIITKQGRSIDELAFYCGFRGAKSNRLKNFHWVRFPNQNRENPKPQKNISNAIAYVLVEEFRVPPNVIKEIVDPTFYQLLTVSVGGHSGIESVDFAEGIGDKNTRKEYERTIVRYLKKAEKSIWISEFVPGLDPGVNPSTAVMGAYAKAHIPVFDAIANQLKKFPNLKYERFFRVPVCYTEEAPFYGLAYSRTLTFQHMKSVYRKHPKQCSLYASPLRRQLSFALIDEKYLIRESYLTKYENGHHAYYPDMLTVERADENKNIKSILYHLRDELEDFRSIKRMNIEFEKLNELRFQALAFFIQNKTSADGNAEKEKLNFHIQHLLKSEKFDNEITQDDIDGHHFQTANNIPFN